MKTMTKGKKVAESKYKFDLFSATMICEGAEDAQDQEHYIAAWQYLIDTGACWSLQGFFGRTATIMIESGHCHAAIGNRDGTPMVD